jgi:hypothetical protein
MQGNEADGVNDKIRNVSGEDAKARRHKGDGFNLESRNRRQGNKDGRKERSQEWIFDRINSNERIEETENGGADPDDNDAYRRVTTLNNFLWSVCKNE